jgi:hypothetical protein
MGERQQALSFTFMLSGLLIWAVHFVVVYGFTGLVCARPGWARLTIGGWELIPFGITLATLLALAALIAVPLASSKRINTGPRMENIRAARLQHSIAIGGAVIALIAISWEAVSALVSPDCR